MNALKEQITQLESEITQLLHSSFLDSVSARSRTNKMFEPVHKAESLANDVNQPIRTKKVRRSGMDRREVGDLSYFKRGGKERRTYAERRKSPNQAPRKRKGLTERLLGG